MTTKSMAYDNPAYLAVVPGATGTLTGVSSASQRFAAFCAMTIKSAEISVVTAGSSASQVVNLMTQSGTTTTTTAITTFGSGEAKAGTNVAVGIDLAQGDAAWFTKGTDATDVFATSLELVIQPGATVTK